MKPALFASLFALASVCHANEPNPFLGSWENPDKTTHDGMTRLDVRQQKNGPFIEVWALAGEEAVSLGKTQLHLLGDFTVCRDCVSPPGPNGEPQAGPAGMPPVKYGFARLDHGFAEVFFTLRLDGDGVGVEDYNVFKNGSGRPSYRSVYELRRAVRPGK